MRQFVGCADQALLALDAALRALLVQPVARRAAPTGETSGTPKQADSSGPAGKAGGDELSPAERKHAGALMRVNHVGEVCAQALYAGQALSTKNPVLRAHFMAAAQEEADHLAWTQQRMQALGARASWLNPLWFAGALGLGLGASKLGDALSLGFVVETERQVQAHLDSHLASPECGGLPWADTASRAVVAQMRSEEQTHADEALAAGAQPLPAALQQAMKRMAKWMTKTAYHF